MKAKLNLCWGIVLMFIWKESLSSLLDLVIIHVCNLLKYYDLFLVYILILLIFISPIGAAVNFYVFIKENRRNKPKDLIEWKKAVE